MTTKTARRALGATLLGLAASLAGCRMERPWDLVPVPALDLPDQFRNDALPPASAAATGCPGRLADPRDQTVLRLRRSIVRGPAHELIGDYEVLPHGRYGGDANTLLRVDCTTRAGQGLVPARA